MCLASIVPSCTDLQKGLVKLVKSVTVLIYTGLAARPHHPNSPDMAAVYSTILTVLYAVPDKLRESPLLFQMPPEKQDRE